MTDFLVFLRIESSWLTYRYQGIIIVWEELINGAFYDTYEFKKYILLSIWYPSFDVSYDIF